MSVPLSVIVSMSSQGAFHSARVLLIGLGWPKMSKGNDSRKYSVCVLVTLSAGWIPRSGGPKALLITGNCVKKTNASAATRLAFETTVIKEPTKPSAPKAPNSSVLRNTKLLSRPSFGWSPRQGQPSAGDPSAGKGVPVGGVTVTPPGE